MRWGDMRRSNNGDDREGAGPPGRGLGGGVKLGGLGLIAVVAVSWFLGLNPLDGRALSVLVELQADCLAGVWGHFARQRNLLEPGDVESGLGAAAAIGDDRLQRQAQGRVSPESFTHGSSAQSAYAGSVAGPTPVTCASARPSRPSRVDEHHGGRIALERYDLVIVGGGAGFPLRLPHAPSRKDPGGGAGGYPG
jgi:hypothetical protein